MKPLVLCARATSAHRTTTENLLASFAIIQLFDHLKHRLHDAYFAVKQISIIFLTMIRFLTIIRKSKLRNHRLQLRRIGRRDDPITV